MVIHIFQTKVLPQDRANAIRTIKAMVGPTKAKPGCRQCSLYSHVDNDDELMLLELWDSQEELDKHIKSPQYVLILEAMELGTEPPRLGIHIVSSSLDLHHVEEVRKED